MLWLPLAILAASATAFRIVLTNEPGMHLKCFSEVVAVDTLVALKYGVEYSSSSDHARAQVLAWVVDPQGKEIWRRSDLTTGSHAFLSKLDGEHKFCFEHTKPDGTPSSAHENVQIPIDINLRSGVDAKDYSEVAKLEHLKPLEVELVKAQDALDSIIKEMQETRRREAEHRDLSEFTNSVSMWMSIISVGCVVSVSMFRSWYMKNYFQSKKLI
eukprot:TRINITY_DN16707_c0_g1_i1.p1 TRINITY_DN16707_c0_g1~~TRINITY_DN16707_c0_g1_i1.p1  ORF type:complete len:214 (-),score=32.02 TRINITY_DN16707_c0_g1_i1:33-674(-)